MSGVTTISGATAAEIATSIRDQVDSGVLGVGSPLPTIRALAADLGVNRNTVAAAYAHLAASGVVSARGRAGTIVRARELAPREGMESAAGVVNLAAGNPDPALLPGIGSALVGYEPLVYGDRVVEDALVAWAKARAEGDVPATASVVITAGAIDAVERLLTAHLVRGDGVAVEDPCFLSSAGVLHANGFPAIPMAMDAEGVLPGALEAALAAGARAVVLTPRAHNPTGATIGRRRAAMLREVLVRHPSVLVIEDDHFSAIADSAYARATPPDAQRWALVRSVSKFLGPDLRLAVVHCDPGTEARLDARLGGAVWVSTILQRIVAGMLGDPATRELLATARRAYRRRGAALADALASRGIPFLRPADGLNLWIPLDRPEQGVVEALRRRGWLVRGGADFAVASDPRPALRVTTATLVPEHATSFAGDLAELLFGTETP